MKLQELQIVLHTTQDTKKMSLILNACMRLLLKNIGKQTKGKRRSNLRKAVYGILYRMKTGCSWRNLPKSYGNWRTIWGWHQRIISSNIFKHIANAIKNAYIQSKHPKGVGRVIIDGSLTRSSSRLSISKNNPRRGNKKCINRMTISDMHGVTLIFNYESGTAHDSRFCIPQLQRLKHQNILSEKIILHADKGFDSFEIRMHVCKNNGFPHIPVRHYKHDAVRTKHKDIRRYKIEATHSWINSFRCLSHIREHSFNALNQLTHFVCGFICSRFMTFKLLRKTLQSC